MLDKTKIQSEFSFLGLIAVTSKLNNLCKLLIEKGVVTEEEINKLNADTVQEITNAFFEE